MATRKRKKHKTDRISIVLGLLVLVAMVLLRYANPPALESARSRVFDAYQTLEPREYQPAPVRVIDIDEKSLALYGQWPWPRDLLAQLVNRLTQLGVATIAFDGVFPEPDRSSPSRMVKSLPDEGELGPLLTYIEKLPDNDQIFAETIARSPVVLGFGFEPTAGKDAPPVKAGFSHAGTDPRGFLPTHTGVVSNLPLLDDAAQGLGSFTIGQSEGTVVRKIPLLHRYGDALYPSLGIEALRVAQGASTIIVRSSDASGEVSIGEAQGLQAVRVGQIEVPSTIDGDLWIHYTEPQPSRLISVSEVLKEDDAQHTADLVNLLAGHIVLVGSSAVGLKDLITTPIRAYEAGVVVHAQALEQMILGLYLERPPWADGAEIFLMSLIGLLMVLLLSRLGALWCAVILVTVGAGILAGSWFAYVNGKLLLDPVYGLLVALLVYMVITFENYLRTEKERGQIRQAFSSYIAPSLVEQLIDDPSRLSLGGESREMTFLFSDIANFTTFTEKCDPETLVGILNQYLDAACHIVMDRGGTIDKFIGDAVVAIFNAPLDQPDHVENAVRCALEFDKFAQEYRAKKKAEGIEFGHTRIGVNSGQAIVGNFGGFDRFDYTAMGDAMNTAARLESVNKYFGTRICVSGAVVDKSNGQFFRPIGNLVLKGKSEGVETFEPLTEEQFQSEQVQRYLEAFEALKCGSESGVTDFVRLQRDFPDDPLAAYHGNRVQAGETGIDIVMEEK